MNNLIMHNLNDLRSIYANFLYMYVYIQAPIRSYAGIYVPAMLCQLATISLLRFPYNVNQEKFLTSREHDLCVDKVKLRNMAIIDCWNSMGSYRNLVRLESPEGIILIPEI